MEYRNKYRYRHGFSIFTLMVFLVGYTAQVWAVADAIDRPALQTHLGEYSVLTAAAYAGSRLVAVGERGLILLSDDEGNEWYQAESPVSVTLTGVEFADDENGYAVGHGGIVLRTTNGGKNWQRLLNGRVLGERLLEDALQARDEEAIHQARLLVDDGPDKPFLDILVINAHHVVVVGAYGFAYESKDGGQTWQSWMDRIDNPLGSHLYSIRRSGERILIAGEQGFVALSVNAGDSFETLDPMYEGSFFTAQLTGDQDIIIAGLRGNVFRSHNNGRDWVSVMNPIASSITASYLSKEGQLFLANQAGIVLALNGNSLVAATTTPLSPLTHLLEKAAGGVLALSIHGVVSIDVGNMQ